MEPGIYDALVTDGLLEAIGRSDGLVARLRDVDAADQPDVLARHVRDAVLRVLGSTRDEGKRVALVNDLLARLDAHGADPAVAFVAPAGAAWGDHV